MMKSIEERKPIDPKAVGDHSDSKDCSFNLFEVQGL